MSEKTENTKQKNPFGKKSLEASLNDWRLYIALWRSYPDLFIDFLLPENSSFTLYFYQRVILRVMSRYRKTYFTLTRGSSKSFLEILSKYIDCVLYPNAKIMIVAPQKNMSAQISQQNIEAIWRFIPLLKNEVKEIQFQRDYTRLIFYNGSELDCVANGESSRGLRRTGLSVEEIIHERFDEDSYNEVVKPIMANNRMASCGGTCPYEIHKKEAILTTAGQKQSFAYRVHQEFFNDMVKGKGAFVIGSSYEMPIAFGLLSRDYINEMKESDTFNPISFLREYGSVWSGSSDNSFVDLDKFRKARVIKHAEDKAVSNKEVIYILAYDVARSSGSKNALSALVVIKLTPRGDGTYRKHVVNIYSFVGTHFLEQAKFIKKKVEDFKAKMLVIDANGLGKNAPFDSNVKMKNSVNVQMYGV